ncbi:MULTISPECIES: NACHT domain-containing protein [unclassified Streptomyces]|uniref:NACHT domain-containing protein n=1 Tax=unclassified Streptomyces TaxID=2593676 RepID=UPI0035D57C99
MDYLSSTLAAVMSEVMREAAKPCVDQVSRELVRRRILTAPQADDLLRAVRAPRADRFATLGLLQSLPDGATPAHVRRAIGSRAFGVFARQLMALALCDEDKAHKVHIEKGLQNLLLRTFSSVNRFGVVPYSGQLFTLLDVCCAEVADAVKKLFRRADPAFSWEAQPLLKAIVGTIEQSVDAMAEEEDGAWRRDYATAFMRSHERIELPDFDLRKRVHHSEIFVAPHFAMVGGEDDTYEPRRAGRARLPFQISFSSLASSVSHTVILGDPGAGKSTASSVIGCRWTEGGRGVCYILKIRNIDFTRSGFDLVATISAMILNSLQQRVTAENISRSLVDGSALVVFDGLDELAETIPGRLASHAIEEASLAYPLARFLVTSRRLGYTAVQLDQSVFHTYTLQPFDVGQVRSYALKWFAFRAEGSEKQLELAVADFMDASESIPDLRENPLLLAVICLLHAGHSELPRSRPKIYRKCVELLLRTWDSHRGIGEHGDLEVLELVLAEVAHLTLFKPVHRDGMTEAQVREVAVEVLLRDAVSDRFEAVALAKQMINLCRGRAWMFTDVAPGSPDAEIFSFTHQSFQEYFAARRLVLTCDTPAELAAEIEDCVLDEKLEIFSQICLSLSGEKFISGPTQVYLHCLRANERRPLREQEAILRFLIRSANLVMLNRSARLALVRKALQQMESDARFKDLPTLMRSGHGSPLALRHVIGEALRERRDRDPAALQRIITRDPWLWEVCLREGIVSLKSMGRLFEGYMKKMVRDDDSCSAEWLMRSLHKGQADQGARDVCISILEGVAEHVRRDGIRTDSGPEAPYALFDNNPMVKLTSRALARHQQLTPDAVVGLVYVAMAFCEVSAHYQPGTITERSGVIVRFMESRLYRTPALPAEVSALPSADRDRIKRWCRREANFFEWVDLLVETG